MGLDAIDDLILNSDNQALWELFHENSKVSFVEPHPIYRKWPSEATVVASMQQLQRVKPFADRAKIELPTDLPSSTRGFDEVIADRVTARAFGGGSIGLDQLTKVLWMSYGVSRDNADSDFPRPFRMVPSGGALYPLEIYLYAARVDGLEPGLYHYDPEDHELDVLHLAPDLDRIAGLMVQSDLARQSAAVIFVSAVFPRSTFKYGDRGYRFVLMEAGHLGQNATLAAQEMGLATTNIGGFNDRAVDRYLEQDGLNESAVYLLLVGTPAPPAPPHLHAVEE